MGTFVSAISDGVGTAISVCGSVVTAIVGASGDLKDLLPVIGLAIGFGGVGWGINTFKSLTWGF